MRSRASGRVVSELIASEGIASGRVVSELIANEGIVSEADSKWGWLQVSWYQMIVFKLNCKPNIEYKSMQKEIIFYFLLALFGNFRSLLNCYF